MEIATLEKGQTLANFKHYMSDLVPMDSFLNIVSNDIRIVSFHY
jgi:hypothetical protein